jgi:hypothetical protein
METRAFTLTSIIHLLLAHTLIGIESDLKSGGGYFRMEDVYRND